MLGSSPMQVGLAFLPANLIMAAFSLGLAARMVMRWGIRRPLAAGLLLAAGTGAVAALNVGYQMAFLAGAVFAALAGLLGA